MRVRAIVAIALLLLPAASSAQRFPNPMPGRRRPTEPVPLPRQPEPIARQLAYQRFRLSIETYPLISYVQAPGFTNGAGASVWTNFGAGTRAEYRFSRFVSGTLDVTSSMWGGPAQVQTAELGTRLHRERTDSRAYPFIDLRFGYTSAYDRGLGSAISDPFGNPLPPNANSTQYSHGWGGIVGVGTEYALTRTFSLTTGVSAARSRLTARDFTSGLPVDRGYAMTSYRLSVGVRYNPVRLVIPQGANTP